MRPGGVCWDMKSTSIRGNLLRPLGGYQPIMEPRSPLPAWQMHASIATNQEPMDDDRNDSGINSCSDLHSSSGSDNSQDCNNPSASYSSPTIPAAYSQYYPTPVISRVTTSGISYPKTPMPQEFNPLAVPKIEPSPPSPEPTIVDSRPPTVLVDSIDNSSTSANRSSPLSSELYDSKLQPSEGEDPIRKLQTAFENNSLGDENKSEGDIDEYDEQGIRVPKVNSHGKIKTFKCKQCDFVAVTKLEFWSHSKEHIKSDKRLTCPKCPFVTEYKHHFEYHLRNHYGSKPFKCKKCQYTCVNKSMLNSHMKSHSNIYQYRCADCSYATKYCHSLKLHLRKYNHNPAMVLNPDGTPNPLTIIDVVGTRRGPKQKSSPRMENTESNPAQMLQNHFAQFMQLPIPYPFLVPNPLTNPLLFRQLVEERERLNSQNVEEKAEESQTLNVEPSTSEAQSEVLDLSKPDPSNQPAKSRRKGRAFKRLPADESSEEDDEDSLKIYEEENQNSLKKPAEEEKVNNNEASNWCQYCNIAFGDVVLYTMHMGYHGFQNPFTCNMCGEECNDRVSFFLHIARNPHT